MPNCTYCEASFDDEEAYIEHLRETHADDLGPIDRRRAGFENGDESDEFPTGPVVLGGVLVVALVAVGAFLLLQSGGGSDSTASAQQPSNVGSVHYHGTMETIVTGDRIDFSRDEYQLQADAFHFEGGDGTQWHVHAQSVTLGYAMSTLDIDVTNSTVTYQGTTYRDGAPNTTVTVTVNGQPVTPSEYVLQQGDRVRIVVERP